MAPFGFAYVSGGAGDEWTMRENQAAFNRWVINPDFMNGTGSANTTLSNHGGRQLDNTVAPMTTLPRMASAVKGRVPIFKLYGSALGGMQGVQAVHTHLKNELTMVMRLAGTPTIKASRATLWSAPMVQPHRQANSTRNYGAYMSKV